MKVAIVENIVSKIDHVSSEIIELSVAAGYTVAVHYEVELDPPHPRHYLPEMKMDRFKHEIQDKDIYKIIFSDTLRPHHMINLEEEIEKEVDIIDKPMLILEIFENKANSLDIKLQVQLAQLKYNLPRLSSQISEAVESERAGFGGSGEQATNVLVSDVRSRIRTLERKIEDIKQQAGNRAEVDVPRLPIVGYYSAGKSTLFNMLTESSREIGEEAFTTMILKTSRSTIADYPLDLIDTVGLVDLPTDILSAFDLMLTEIFSFPGMILCLNTNLSFDRFKSHLDDYRDYVKKFTSDHPPKIIIALTKTDLVEQDKIIEYRNYIQSLDWPEPIRIIQTRHDNVDSTQQSFINTFEELFSDKLTRFYYQHLHPSTASKIHNVARVEEQEWHNDGTTSMTGIGPTPLLNELKGEIFQ